LSCKPVDSYPEGSAELIDPPFENRPPGSYVLLDIVPLSPEFRPEDLAPLRARVEQIAQVVVRGEVDPGMIVGLSEAVTNAADIASLALAGIQHVPRRHAVEVKVGYRGNEIVWGVTDDSRYWTRSPERPGTTNPDEDLDNFLSFSSSQVESDEEHFTSAGTTGRGSLVIERTARRVTYTTEDNGKTVWASYPHSIVPEAARFARATHRKHLKSAVGEAVRTVCSFITHRFFGHIRHF